MDWVSWLALPLIALSLGELLGVEGFAESVYRFGPVVWRERWYAQASFGSGEFNGAHGAFSLTSSGDVLFKARSSLGRISGFPIKGRARHVDGAVEVTVRLPLFPLLTVPLALIAGLFGNVELDARAVVVVVVVLAVYSFITYMGTAGAVRELREHVTGLTSASS